MAEYRVLVTGSRDWVNTLLIHDTLDALLAEHGTLIVVHGASLKGADEIARKWALAAIRRGRDVRTEPHPPDWHRYGKRAGFLRNEEMVAAGADECLAWIMPCAKCRRPQPHGSHGATHCARLAEKAGIPTRRFTDG